MKKVLILMGRYLPGYKDGGPVRTIANLVDGLGDNYEFRIVTNDRDHNDLKEYPNIKVSDWNTVGKAMVYYVPPNGFTFSLIRKLSQDVNLIYCSGTYNDYSYKTMLLRKINIIKQPIVIASMGSFSSGAFKMKISKKRLFVTLFKKLGLFSG